MLLTKFLSTSKTGCQWNSQPFLDLLINSQISASSKLITKDILTSDLQKNKYPTRPLLADIVQKNIIICILGAISHFSHGFAMDRQV